MKPSNLIYGLEDSPNVTISLLLGLQHTCLCMIGLVFPVLVVRAMGGSTQDATFIASMSLLAGGVGVILQSLSKGPVGSGYLCPQLSGPSFLTASVLAAKTGGLSLLLGMTMIAGLFETLFSRLIKRLQFFFPPEVTGLIVAMVGITVVKIAGLNFLGMSDPHAHPDINSVVIGAITLFTMIGLNVWTKGQLRLFCIIVGMVTGYLASASMGLLHGAHWGELARRPLVWMPFTHHPGWSFDAHLILPFLIAMLCSSLKSVGDLTTCQKINDSDWKRPDMENISKGILADGLGCFAAGIFGGYGQSTSSSNIGLSIATGTTSRSLAWFMGGIMIFLAFCPKFAAVFAIMPKPVIGATLLFSMSFMIVAGFQIIMSRMMDNRKTFVVGISMILGLMVDDIPHAFEGLPELVGVAFSSSLSTAAISAVVLNLILRIGIADKAGLTLRTSEPVAVRVFEFMDKQGAKWGARKEVFSSATVAVSEFVECIVPAVMQGDQMRLTLQFDEYKLIALIEYEGEPVTIREQVASCVDPQENKIDMTMISWQIIRHYIKNFKCISNGPRQIVRLQFDH